MPLGPDGDTGSTTPGGVGEKIDPSDPDSWKWLKGQIGQGKKGGSGGGNNYSRDDDDERTTTSTTSKAKRQFKKRDTP